MATGMTDRGSPPGRQPLEEARALCQKAAERHEQADYAAARTLYERALDLLEPLAGQSEAETALCLNGLGQVLMKQGDYEQARPLIERALSLRKRVLGPEHPEVAASLHTLGELESDQGNFETGVLLLGQAFSLRKQALGDEHPDTLDSMVILSLMVAHQGKRDLAEGLLQRALSLCEQSLGENHLITARVLNGLGRVWAASEPTYERARTMYRRALAIYEHLLGQTHPFTALVLNNLAAVLADLHDYEAALPLLERSLIIHERVYGPANWRTSFVLVNLADVHSQEGNAAAARPLLERALIIRERAWGARHPETVTCLRKLVAALGTLQQQGDEGSATDGFVLYPCLVALEAAAGTPELGYQPLLGSHLDPDKAAQRLHQWVAAREADQSRPPLSAADREVLQSAKDLLLQADAKHDQGDYAAAIALREHALHLQEEVLGQVHLDHVDVLRKLANAHARAGRYSAILPLTQRIVDIHVQTLGPEHPMTGIALSELMAQTAFDFGPAAALPLQEQLLQSMEEALGAGDPLVELARRSVDHLREASGEVATGRETRLPSLSERREQAVTKAPPSGQDPLAGLGDISWHDLHHAYGPADDVPNLLRMLISDDEDVRQSAWQELYGNLIHQGDVYQATAYAVPFLVQLLDWKPDFPGEPVPDKQDILAYLEAVASGGPGFSEDQDWMEEVLAEQGRDFHTEVERAQSYAQAARAAVRDGLDAYHGCLNHPAALAREAAFALLCAFPECAGDLQPVLLSSLELEPDSAVKARMVGNLGSFLAPGWASAASRDYGRAAALTLFGLLLQPEEDRGIRFATALALAHLEGDAAPPEAWALLEEAVVEPRGLLPGRTGEGDEPAYLLDLTVENACLALSHLSPERRIPILIRLLERARVPGHAHRVAILLLDSAFLGQGRGVEYSGTPEATDETVYYALAQPVATGDLEERIYPGAGEARDLAALTPAQKQALRAVLDCKPLWRIRSNLFEIYGLPHPRAVLRKSI